MTPFLTTAIRGNIKCLEIISHNPENKIDIRDKNGNSIYHIFAEHGHIDCFRYIAKQFYDKTHKLLTSSNNQEETVLCIAARRGNLDLIKIIYNLLNDTSFEEVFSIQNNDGQTCFHIACLFGYINIAEYFLKDLKMIDILEQVDNNSNTPLHLASYGGHLNLVQLLLSYNSEFSLKNIDKLTSLDLSCRKGEFHWLESNVETLSFTSCHFFQVILKSANIFYHNIQQLIMSKPMRNIHCILHVVKVPMK